MIIKIGLENGIEGRSLAWALDFPGSFAYGKDGSTALLGIPQAMLNYETWMSHHTSDPWVRLGDFDIRLVDSWQVYSIDDVTYEEVNDGYEVNAWFHNDWRPLNDEETAQGLALLSWSRADLLAVSQNLSQEVLDATYPNERWSIRGILGHVATAEWWYLSRLNLSSGTRQELPQDVFERLATVRKQMTDSLPGLSKADRVIGKQGEFWSPRKLLRRAIWHEMDHIGHITRLVGMKKT